MVREFFSIVLYFHEFHNQIMNYEEPIFYPACNLKINLSYQDQPWKQQPKFEKHRTPHKQLRTLSRYLHFIFLPTSHS